jgi:hypothetical protein
MFEHSPACIWWRALYKFKWSWGFTNLIWIGICRKHKESAHVACVTNPVSQLILEISPIWNPLTSEDISKLQSSSVWSSCLFFQSFCDISFFTALYWSVWLSLTTGNCVSYASQVRSGQIHSLIFKCVAFVCCTLSLPRGVYFLVVSIVVLLAFLSYFLLIMLAWTEKLSALIFLDFFVKCLIDCNCTYRRCQFHFIFTSFIIFAGYLFLFSGADFCC